MENKNIVWLRLLFSNVKIANLEDKKNTGDKIWGYFPNHQVENVEGLT